MVYIYRYWEVVITSQHLGPSQQRPGAWIASRFTTVHIRMDPCLREGLPVRKPEGLGNPGSWKMRQFVSSAAREHKSWPKTERGRREKGRRYSEVWRLWRMENDGWGQWTVGDEERRPARSGWVDVTEGAGGDGFCFHEVGNWTVVGAIWGYKEKFKSSSREFNWNRRLGRWLLGGNPEVAAWFKLIGIGMNVLKTPDSKIWPPRN